MSNNIYGYVFAISEEEEEEEHHVMASLSIPGQNIFADRLWENGDQRPVLDGLERKLCRDDLVYIRTLNMLGSSYDQILSHWEILTDKQRAGVAVLDMPLLDTRRGKDFMETLVKDVIREMLVYAAENEHGKNRRRAIESHIAAKEKGVKYGRPISPLPENFELV